MQNRTRNFLIGLTLNEMQSILAEAGYTHKSPALLAHHVYKKTGKEIHDIHAYPLKLREYLSARYTSAPAQPLQSMLSSDGSAKYLFCNHEGLYYETVRMPEERRETVCISSQSGCRYGCRFCNTGKTGFLGDLDSYEILSQVSGTGPLPSHVVFMGMGEPLDNYENVKKSVEILSAQWGYSLGARYITLSTVGLIPQLERACLELPCNIAISLHSPFPEERQKLIPAEIKNPLQEAVALLRRIPFERKRRLSFEYTLIKGVNDSSEHAKATAQLLSRLDCHMNLIACSPIPGTSFVSPDVDTIETFRQYLNKGGLRATIRKSRGQDISAACGMMAGKMAKKSAGE